MSSTEMVTPLGEDRCLMKKGHLSRFVRGGGWIGILLAAGWEIVPDERNHLMGSYGDGIKGRLGDLDIILQGELSGEAPLPPAPRKGRPKGSKSKNKYR